MQTNIEKKITQMKNIINKSYTETKKYKEDEAGEEEGVEDDNQEGKDQKKIRGEPQKQ